MNQLRATALFAVALTTAGVVLFSCAEPASATEPELPAPPVAEAPEQSPYQLALWEVPGGAGDLWGIPQQLVGVLPLTTPTLDSFTGSLLLKCGTYYQIDLYHSSPATDALLAGGVLYGPSNPAEDLAYGAVQGDPWRFLQTAECEDLAPEVEQASSRVIDCGMGVWLVTSTTTTRGWVFDPVTDGYVLGTPVETTASATEPAAVGDCPTLARTGPADWMAPVAVGAGVVILTGLVLSGALWPVFAYTWARNHPPLRKSQERKREEQ